MCRCGTLYTLRSGNGPAQSHRAQTARSAVLRRASRVLLTTQRGPHRTWGQLCLGRGPSPLEFWPARGPPPESSVASAPRSPKRAPQDLGPAARSAEHTRILMRRFIVTLAGHSCGYHGRAPRPRRSPRSRSPRARNNACCEGAPGWGARDREKRGESSSGPACGRAVGRGGVCKSSSPNLDARRCKQQSWRCCHLAATRDPWPLPIGLDSVPVWTRQALIGAGVPAPVNCHSDVSFPLGDLSLRRRRLLAQRRVAQGCGYIGWDIPPSPPSLAMPGPSVGPACVVCTTRWETRVRLILTTSQLLGVPIHQLFLRRRFEREKRVACAVSVPSAHPFRSPRNLPSHSATRPLVTRSQEGRRWGHIECVDLPIPPKKPCTPLSGQ